MAAANLTNEKRDREIARLAQIGVDAKDIAARLGISKRAVEHRLRRERDTDATRPGEA